MTVRLTPAQERLIPFIIEGLSYPAIAQATGLGVRTVKMHVYQIAAHIPSSPFVPTFRRVQAWAIEHGYGTQQSLLAEASDRT